MPIVQRAYVDESQVEALVREAEKLLAPDVIRIRHSFGEDWSGDPAIYFRVVLRDEAAVREKLLAITTKAKNTVRSQVNPDKLGVLSYFNFRTVSEQAQLQDPDWD